MLSVFIVVVGLLVRVDMGSDEEGLPARNKSCELYKQFYPFYSW